jgi:ABC-type sugar transport system ATPase subunit
VTKAFGATRALVDCSFELQPGEVHAIVGENGSGKSTLVKILAGVHRPDGGRLRLGGEELSGLRSPRAAQSRGIVAVFQEILTIGARSVLDNVWLGQDRTLVPAAGSARRAERVRAALAELLDDAPRLDQPVERLTLSERQACCLARALVHEPRILILDESTSALDVQTRSRLFDAVRRRAADGMGAIFISHRMDEVQEIADRVTVMRSGETVAAGLARADAAPQELVRLMTGAGHLVQADTRTTAARNEAGEVVVRTRELRLREASDPIDVEIRSGELLGLAGLEGHGQDAFLAALAGGVGGSVVSVAAGGETEIASPWHAADERIFYLPRERRAEALFSDLSVRENFASTTMTRDVRWGVLRHARTGERLAAYARRLGIVFGDHRQPIHTLSGGNQQKVIIARLLAADPRVLLLNDPTRGIDLGAKRDLYALLVELAEAGVAVVMLSSEVDEHIELMDRVLVFREHALFRELNRGELDRETLIASFFGRTEAHRA